MRPCCVKAEDGTIINVNLPVAPSWRYRQQDGVPNERYARGDDRTDEGSIPTNTSSIVGDLLRLLLLLRLI